MNLDLTPDEADLLRDLLDAEMRDGRMEIADTDNVRFKRELRERQDVLRGLIEKLGG
jgi:hypothetical protein